MSDGVANREPTTTVDQLELPSSLERVGATIRVTGHRVSLFRILDAYLDGVSVDRIGEMFPTIPTRKLEEVMAFCGRHADLLRRYHAERQAAFAAEMGGRPSEAPSAAELRRRRAESVGPDRRND